MPMDDSGIGSRDEMVDVNGSFESDTGIFVEKFIANHGMGHDTPTQLDIWSQISLDSRAVSVAATRNYVAYVDSKQIVRFASLGNPEFSWDSIDEKAEQLAISEKGNIIWRLENGTAFTLIRPSSLAPKGQKWVEAARGEIICISVTGSTAWYLKKPGQVFAQLELNADRPCYKVTKVSCDWPLIAVTCIEEAVWGLRDDGRLVIRVGLTRDNPLGTDWVDVFPDGPSELVSISLCRNTGWAVDVNGRLWFTTGVTFKHPFGRTGRWWQPMCLAGTLSVLWVLDAKGKIFIRSGIDARHSPLGKQWERLDMTQLGPDVHLTHLTCTLDAVWAVDRSGGIWVRLGTGTLLAGGLSSAWVPLDAPKGTTDLVKEIHASSDGALVWAMGAGGRVWSRYGITQDMPIGSAWTEVEGMQCKHVGVGSEVVWALDSSGQLYRRHGLRAENPSGNYWKKLPATLRHIAVTPVNRLWGLDETKRLVKHQVKIYWPAEQISQSEPETLPSSPTGTDFELV